MNNKGRISLLELIIIILLILEGAFILLKSGDWLADKSTSGNDRLLENTADSTARVNSLNGMDCPVDGCGRGALCTHKQGDYYVGYFESVSHKIVAYPPKGYNQNYEMRIGKTKYYGDPGTMVIEIRCKEGVVELNWVKGR